METRNVVYTTNLTAAEIQRQYNESLSIIHQSYQNIFDNLPIINNQPELSYSFTSNIKKETDFTKLI